LIKFIL
jgi:hypothetical protein